MTTSKLLTIFEGPDGAGKTTAAKSYALRTEARYVHFPALPLVNHGLARMYVEAMLPALLGYQDVVFDRCWLSEIPYGEAFREGQDRLTVADRRMLERLALRCGGVLIRCQPPWNIVKANYLARKHLELLDNDQQLKEVYDLYAQTWTSLTTMIYDYTFDGETPVWPGPRLPCHPLNLASAGNWNARTVLVGEAFAERKDQDALYQWPFASFSGAGCSRWLAEQLELAEKPEHELLWLNADQLDRGPRLGGDLVTNWLQGKQVYALGEVARQQLVKLGIPCQAVTHPQYHKRFKSSEPYLMGIK